MQFFSTSPTKNLCKVDSRNSPLILSGLANFLFEQKMNKSSILSLYYNKAGRSSSFTLEEEEEEVVDKLKKCLPLLLFFEGSKK